jgi:TfoX/Sxy family transcriptional regulator of competence genes
MAYDEKLAARIRELFPADGVEEKKMFGGIAFMLGGNMVCGVTKDDLMVRVGPDKHEAALDREGARPMDFAGRPMRGMVFVRPAGYASDADLRDWLDLALAFATTLPPKQAKAATSRRSRK